MKQALVDDLRALDDMLNMQRKLQESLGYDIKNMSFWEKTSFIKEFSIHLNQEMNEMLYELPHFKPWKDYSNMTDYDKVVARQRARNELVDMWHFFMNIMLGLDMSAYDLYEGYRDKNAENYRRQEEGYTHDKQYR